MNIQNWQCFEFLFNVGGLEGPVEVLPGHVVDRATPEEITVIREVLTNIRFTGSPAPWGAYESSWVTTESPEGHKQFAPTPLPEGDWRYFVVRYKGANTHISLLQRAFSLTAAEPEMLFTSISENGTRCGFAMNPTRANHFLTQAMADTHLVQMTTADLNEVKELVIQLQKHDHEVLDLAAPLTEYAYLGGTDPAGRLRFLGHFAVLESLLSHEPKSSDPYDSVTRQVRGKMILVGNRSGRIDYTKYFGSLGPDKAWTKLYDYRSAIAHGAKADFTGKHEALKSAANALSFVRHATRELLRFSLKEPALVHDLKWT